MASGRIPPRNPGKPGHGGRRTPANTTGTTKGQTSGTGATIHDTTVVPIEPLLSPEAQIKLDAYLATRSSATLAGNTPGLEYLPENPKNGFIHALGRKIFHDQSWRLGWKAEKSHRTFYTVEYASNARVGQPHGVAIPTRIEVHVPLENGGVQRGVQVFTFYTRAVPHTEQQANAIADAATARHRAGTLIGNEFNADMSPELLLKALNDAHYELALTPIDRALVTKRTNGRNWRYGWGSPVPVKGNEPNLHGGQNYYDIWLDWAPATSTTPARFYGKPVGTRLDAEVDMVGDTPQIVRLYMRSVPSSEALISQIIAAASALHIGGKMTGRFNLLVGNPDLRLDGNQSPEELLGELHRAARKNGINISALSHAHYAGGTLDSPVTPVRLAANSTPSRST